LLFAKFLTLLTFDTCDSQEAAAPSFQRFRVPSHDFLLKSLSHLTLTKVLLLRSHQCLEERGYFGIVSTTLPASTEPFKFIQQKKKKDI